MGGEGKGGEQGTGAGQAAMGLVPALTFTLRDRLSQRSFATPSTKQMLNKPLAATSGAYSPIPLILTSQMRSYREPHSSPREPETVPCVPPANPLVPHPQMFPKCLHDKSSRLFPTLSNTVHHVI